MWRESEFGGLDEKAFELRSRTLRSLGQVAGGGCIDMGISLFCYLEESLREEPTSDNVFSPESVGFRQRLIATGLIRLHTSLRGLEFGQPGAESASFFCGRMPGEKRSGARNFQSRVGLGIAWRDVWMVQEAL